MLPVTAKPMLERLIERCVEAGLTRFYVALTEHPLAVRRFLGEGRRWGAEIMTSDYRAPCSWKEVLKRTPADPDDHVLLIPAETIIDVDFRNLLEFHEREGARVAVVSAREFSPEEAESPRSRRPCPADSSGRVWWR
jgi:NDP-sugar pyrophosphorylase family protein